MSTNDPPLLVSLLSGAAASAIRNVGQTDASALSPADTASVVASVKNNLARDPSINAAQGILDEAATPVPWYQSSTFLAALVSFVCSILGLAYGVTVPEHVQTDLIVPLLGTLVASVAGLVARYRQKVRPISTTKLK